jgi:hypothetical protein
MLTNPRCGVAEVFGTGVSIITVLSWVDTLPCKRIACVYGAKVSVIACLSYMRALSIDRVTLVNGARIAVITCCFAQRIAFSGAGIAFALSTKVAPDGAVSILCAPKVCASWFFRVFVWYVYTAATRRITAVSGAPITI